MVFALLAAYFIFINLDGLLIMAVDKDRARREARRTPEALIFLIAALGGSVGVYAGMRLFHHKTLHTSFTVGIPLMIFAQAVLAAVLYLLLR